MQLVQTQQRFQAGGTVRDGAFYVERKADQALLDALLRGEYCYVLAPRQIGKSSLRTRTEKRLKTEGSRCVGIDLTRMGSSQVTQDEWFFGLVEELASRLDLDDPVDFWLEQERLAPVHRWSLYLRNEVLARLDEPIVIFFDEIDVTLSLPFSRDDFFASVRACFNARAEDAAYERLTFCLLGVAAPADLIADPTRTPFNIGRDVFLEDFSRQEMMGFLPGIRLRGGTAHEALNEVYRWTNGHPYMTQRIFEVLHRKEWEASESLEGFVARHVRGLFLTQSQQDTNLAVAEKLFQHNEHKARMLLLYRQLIEGHQVEANLYKTVHAALRLTGMISTFHQDDKTYLKIRNHIFASVFDLRWVKKQETDRLFGDAMSRWLNAERGEDYVLRGQALQEAEAWAEGRDDLTAEERAFLFAGHEVKRLDEERQRNAEVEREKRLQAEKQSRYQKRMISLLGALVLTLVGLLVFAYWQFHQAQEARRQAIQAQKGEQKQKENLQVALRQTQREKKNKTIALGRAQKAERDAKAKGHRVLQLLRKVRVSLRKERQAKRRAQQATSKAKRLGREERAQRLRAQQAEKAAQEGNRAILLSAQTGREMSALRAGILSVAPLLHNHQLPPIQSLEGLFSSVSAARSSRSFRDHRRPLVAAILSPKGDQLLTASTHLKLWDVRQGRTLASRKARRGKLLAAVVSPKWRWVASSSGKTIRLSAIKTCARPSKPCLLPHKALNGHNGGIRGLAFSSDGQRLVSGSDDGTVRFWNVSTGQLLRTFRGHTGKVYAVAISSSGKWMASAGTDRTIRLWHLSTKRLRTLRGHQGIVLSVRFSPDDRFLLSASTDKTARLWRVSDGKAIRKLIHSAQVNVASFVPGRSWLATGGKDRVVRLWSRRGSPLRVLDGHSGGITGLSFSQRGRWMATASRDQTARIWKLHRDDALLVLRGHQGEVSDVRFSRSGHQILTASGDATARLWQVQKRGTEVWKGRLLRRLKGHKAWVTAALFSHDQKWLVTSSLDESIRLWNRKTGRLIRRLDEGQWLETIAFAPHTPLLAGGKDLGAIGLHDLKHPQKTHILRGHRSAILSLAFSPKGRWLASGSNDHTLRLWNLKTRGAKSTTFEGHTDAVLSVSFSPNGRRLLSASKDGTARIWRRRDGKQLAVLRGHQGWVHAAHFSRDGKRIVTAGKDHSVRLWDSATTRQIIRFRGHTAGVRSARFSPDGQTIVTGSADRSIRLFPASETLFLQMACRLLQHQREFQQVHSHCTPYVKPPRRSTTKR